MPDTFNIEMTATFVGKFIDPDDRWEHNLWDVFLTRDGHGSMSLKWRRGTGLTGEPSLIEVLDGVRRDAQIVEFDEFDEVLAEVPFSQARKIVEATTEQTDALRGLLGDDWEAFLETEYAA